jgi:mono/diheme cytochrome c family protein
MATRSWLVLVVVLAMASAACSKNSQAPDGEPLVRRAEEGAAVLVGERERAPEPATKAAPMPAPVATPTAPVGAIDGPAAFAARCAGCHGATGRGDGMMAAAFAVRPRSFADAAWQASVTDADIAKVIVGGSAAVGKSDTMPAAPDLAQQPAVVDALVKVVRGFGR